MNQELFVRVSGADFRQQFRKKLLRWFDANKRALPWRLSRDPYRVWVSEIMLQQTRVAVVVDYYERFMRRFPDVHALAKAREASVLAVWSGLGYYRRARSLHAAARIVVCELGGRFPDSAERLLQLPGVGRYTAAAIASIAFGESSAVVDGNVERVLRRALGDQKLAGERTWQLAQQMLSPRRPGDFNEAMMELGATVCLPSEPACNSCPVRSLCKTLGRGTARRASQRQKHESTYTLAIKGASVYLVQRPGNAARMPGLWEFPETANGSEREILFTLRHSITNTDYRVTVIKGGDSDASGGRWISCKRVEALALTGLARKILRKIEVII
jgi:A/G-specific adenine glycosylase